MAEAVTHGAAKFKDAQGNTVVVQGLSNNDVSKVKQYFQKSDTNESEIKRIEGLVKSVNQGQRMIALKDYYTTEDNKDEMAVGVYYMVPFNAADEYLEWDEKTGKPKADQNKPNVDPPEKITDLKVAYFQIVMKNSDDGVNKLGKQEVQPTFKDVAFLSANNTFAGDNTFSKNVTCSVTQSVDDLPAQALATGKFVRDTVTKKISEAGHLAGKYSASDPGESVEANQIVFYPTPDLLA